jgi:subtilisin family serine protease
VRRSLIPAALSPLLVASLFVPPSGAADRGQAAPQAARRPQKAAYQARGEFVPGQVLVKFREGVSRAQERAVHGTVASRVLQRIAGGLGIDHVRLPRGLEVAEAIRRYEADPAVEYAEPNFYRYPTSFPTDPPSDSFYSNLWALNNSGQAHPISDPLPATAVGSSDADMDVAEAWDTETGDPGVIVAVLDSGVDTSHVDLGANLWVNPGEIPGDGLDNDGNGKADDVNGFDVAEDDAGLLGPATAIGYNHGTHVAGTIAAVTDNATGVSGVCGGDWDPTTPQRGCSIMVIKFMDDLVDIDGDGNNDMVGTLAAELAGIAYARQMGAHIINGSYGGPSWSNAQREAIRKAGAQSDILFVAAAANDSVDNDMGACFGPSGPCSPAYPASYNLPHILTVAASNHNDEYGYFTGCAMAGDPMWFCAFTNFGRYSVDVAAPGVDILSTVPGNSYATFNGTSMAAPHTAGVAGLLLSKDGSRSALTLKNIIMATADTSDSLGNPLPLNQSMNTWLFLTERTGKFTRTSARVNANDAVDFVGTPPNGSANHDGDIPGAKGLKARTSRTLGWPADVNDVFKKKLLKGKTYRFTLVVPSRRNFDLFLLKPDTKEIWQPRKALRLGLKGPGGDESFTFKPGATKRFFIHVSWWFGGNGKYTLKVVCIKNC